MLGRARPAHRSALLRRGPHQAQRRAQAADRRIHRRRRGRPGLGRTRSQAGGGMSRRHKPTNAAEDLEAWTALIVEAVASGRNPGKSTIALERAAEYATGARFPCEPLDASNPFM